MGTTVAFRTEIKWRYDFWIATEEWFSIFPLSNNDGSSGLTI